MLKKITDVKDGLRGLGLSDDEIEIYLALVHASSSPLELAQKTGIKRTKVYSLLRALEKRSLIVKISQEEGSRYGVTDPTNLGIEVSEFEALLKERQEAVRQLIPMLSALRGISHGNDFIVRTYEGEEGFKQMLWHELKSQGEQLSFGGGDVEEFISSRVWANRYRERAVEAGYRIREIINSEIDLPTPIHNKEYLERYSCRGISARILPLENQIVIYNDTVSIYNWRQEKKTGTEITSKSFANTMRAVFDSFWMLTEPTNQQISQYPKP